MNHTSVHFSEIDQYRFLIELDDAIRLLIDPEEITYTAATVLGQYLGVNRCAYAYVEDELDSFTLTGNYTNGVPSIVGRYKSSSFGEEFVRLSRAGLPYVVDDAEDDPRTADVLVAYRATQIRAVICVPVIKSGRFVACMAVHQNTPRSWQKHESKLLLLVANRCWESIERNRVARELKDSEGRLREGLVAARMAVWDWDLVSGKVTFAANSAKAFGYSWVTEEDGWNAIHPEDRLSLRAAVDQAIAECNRYETVVRMVRPVNAEVIWVEVRGTVLCDGKGKAASIRGVFLDVTDRKRAEEALREEHRRKDEFLAMLAHELRNPLAPISAAAQMLSLVSKDEKRVLHVSEIVSRQIGHITKLVDDLLDVSRVNRGLVMIHKERIDMNLLVREAVDQVAQLIDARHHRLTIKIPSEPSPVFGDKTRLVQIITNLLANAAKYTSQGGEILLSLDVDGDHLELMVKDNGIGLSPGLLPHVFDLFVQGERTLDRSQGGLGLGLALVKNLVSLHEGRIAARSAGMGQGSEFVVILPRLKETESIHSTNTVLGYKPSSSNALSIMVVDDNADAAQTMAMLLEAQGHTVWVEHDGSAAIQQATGNMPDVFILDIGLPEMDGNELAKRLRAQPETANAVLIAVTGYGQEKDRKHTLAAGFNHHLVKPVDTKELASILATIPHP